ncbi:hypothetical protein D5281_23430 [bacterium 1xD42-62]|uniref:Uncharacterized protein n=1 Tax=Parablautia muri TaxID=2320879 RepID=A0A9X5BKI4_9FIRM|nr:hypothetical protein [Parablautia muri]
MHLLCRSAVCRQCCFLNCPLGKLRLLPFSELCVQTKAKVRLLSAHKVYECAPLPCRQNVGVAYG